MQTAAGNLGLSANQSVSIAGIYSAEISLNLVGNCINIVSEKTDICFIRGMWDQYQSAM